MKISRILISVAVLLVLGGASFAADTDAPSPEKAKTKPAPSWEALSESAKELSASRFSPEDLAAQVEKKEGHLKSLYKQRAALEAQTVSIIGSTKKSLAEIDAIDDPVLRDESLLRFRASKDIRLKTVRATLDAVNGTIERERKELATLQRLLQGRRAEARLYGQNDEANSSYKAFLAAEAARVRGSEQDVVDRIHEERLATLQKIILPGLAARLPDFDAAVLESTREQ